MEVLGAVASVVSLVALTAQIRDIWITVKSSSEAVCNILDDLQILTEIIDALSFTRSKNEEALWQPKVSTRAIERCEANIRSVAAIADQIRLVNSSGFANKTRTALNIFVKKSQILRSQALLERSKTTLILEYLRLHGDFQTNHLCSIQRQIADSVLLYAALYQQKQVAEAQHYTASEEPENRFDLSPLDASQGLPEDIIISSRQSFTENFHPVKSTSHTFHAPLGKLTLVASLHEQSLLSKASTIQPRSQHLYRWSVRIIPSEICQRLFRYGADLWLSQRKAYPYQRSQTLRFGLRVFPVVPSSSQIFEATKTGNLDWMKALFDRGEASPSDTDPRGWSPLHIAAYWKQLEACKLLLQLGAEADSVTGIRLNPLMLAAVGDKSNEELLLSLLSLLVDYDADISYQDTLGDDAMYLLREAPRAAEHLRRLAGLECYSAAQTRAAGSEIIWAIETQQPAETIASLLQQGFNVQVTNGYRIESGGPLHSAAATLVPLRKGICSAAEDHRKKMIVKLLLSHGVPLHAVDDQGATPLDLLLEMVRRWRCRKILTIWREALTEHGVDWQEYLDTEAAMHTSRDSYSGAQDFYWSMQQQRDYWLSDAWEDESELRHFWNPETLDWDPIDDDYRRQFGLVRNDERGGSARSSASEVSMRSSSSSGLGGKEDDLLGFGYTVGFRYALGFVFVLFLVYASICFSFLGSWFMLLG